MIAGALPEMDAPPLLLALTLLSASYCHPPGGANRRCDCDSYRPDTLEGGIEFVAASVFRKVSMRLGKLRFMVEIHLLSRLLLRNAGSCLPKG